MWLHKDDLKEILEFMDSFETSNDVVLVTRDDSSGIGYILTVSLNGVMVKNQFVTVSKQIVDESGW